MMRKNFMRYTFAIFRGVPQRMKFYALCFLLRRNRSVMHHSPASPTAA